MSKVISLQLVRESSTVNSLRLAYLLYDGKERFDDLKNIWNFIENDPIFDKSARAYLNHTQRYNASCKKIARFAEIITNLRIQELNSIYDAYLAVDENLPIDVHLSMFIPILQLHCDESQRKLWLSDALEFRMIGAYAQTELAHGSNIRGIETTATYDIIKDEFIIHSPTLTSRKFWPGGLAYTATHAIVYANLLLFGISYGPHPFMVPLRNKTDMTVLQGITLGDIGPKLGYNSMDNGYAMFDNVRIPRENMLAGFAQVSGSGQYSKQKGAEKVAYGVMLDVRARIIANSAYVLARTLTIAIRYSIVRQQGFDAAGVERSVFSYPTQKRALVEMLAYTYALHFTGKCIRRAYDDYGGKNMDLLPDLHASTACLKALITFEVSQSMEACRKLCGGHGFLVSAGFAELQMSYLPFCTLEGTKEVLYQQTGRYLVKTLLAGNSTTVSSSSGVVDTLRYANIAYLFEGLNSESEQIHLTVEMSYEELIRLLLQAYKRRARMAVQKAVDAISSPRQREGLSEEDAHTAAGIELCAAAEYHSKLLIASAFSAALASSPSEDISKDEYYRLKQLLVLHLLCSVSADLGSFLSSKSISISSTDVISSFIAQLILDLSPHALNIIEGYQFTDKRLDSVLGRYDGNVYEAIVEAVQREPLNQGAAREGAEHLQRMFNRPRKGTGNTEQSTSESLSSTSKHDTTARAKILAKL